MTDLRQAAQQALEALEELDGLDTETECVTIDVGDVITALKAALEQQAEPVAWQPIETAPKDEIVLLCLPLIGNIREGDRRVYEGRWHEAQATWTSVNGFLLLGAATDWMPLPQPPITAHGIKEGT